MGLSLKNLAHHLWDQVDIIDNGRTWKNPQGNNKPGVKAPSAWQQLKTEVSHVPTQARRAGTAVGLGGVRSLTGMAQGATGLYDLLTPGKGTSQASKFLGNFARFTDQTAQAEHVDPFLYHAAQTGTDLLSFAVGGGELKALSKAPQVSRFIAPVMDHSAQFADGIDKSVEGAPVVQRAMGAATKGIFNPTNQALNVAYTAKATGENASKGRKTTPGDVAKNYAMGLAADATLPAVGVVGKQAVKSGAKSVIKTAKAVKNFEGPPRPDLEHLAAAKPKTAAKPKAGVAATDTKEVPLKPTFGKDGKIKLPEPKNSLVSKAKRLLVDSDQHILDTIKASDKTHGRTDLRTFMYNSGIQRRANRLGEHNFTSSPHIREALNGLTKKEYKEFNQYAAARRELTYPKGAKTSAPRAELQAVKDKFHAKYGDRYAHLREFYRKEAIQNYKHGLIDKKTLNKHNKSDDYIRLQRSVEDLVNKRYGSGNAYSLRSTSLKQKVKGSTRQVDDVFGTALKKAQQNANERSRNLTSSHLIDVLEHNGQAKRVTHPTGKNIVARHVAGKVQYYEVSQEMKQAVERINPFELNAVMQTVAAPGRLFRATTTGLDPVFTLTNWVKDQTGSAINSSSAHTTHTPENIAEGLVKAVQNLAGVDIKDSTWEAFIKHAGDQTSYDMTRNSAGAKRVLRSVQGGAKNKLINVASNPLRALENANSATEIATRYQNFKGVYDKVLKDGGSKEDANVSATLAAWQHSVDFNRTGDFSRLMNILIPYWNPGVQGTRQMFRSFHERPGATTAKTASVIMAPVIAATAWNMSDPKRKAAYNNVSDYEKENNLILMLPHTDPKKSERSDNTYAAVKIPLPPGIGSLAGVTRRLFESHANKNPVPFGQLAGDILTAGAGPVSVQSKTQLASSFVPQALKPAANQVLNKDLYTGKQIVPDYINKDTDANGNPLPEKDKRYKFSSGSAEILGNIANKSPIRIEKAVRDTFGTVGQYTLNAADNALAKAGVIGSDNIGGISPKGKITRRFAEVQAKENLNQTAAQKHFGYVAKALAGIKLTQNEASAYNIIHPQTKNSLGQAVNDKTPVDPIIRAAAYLKYPKLWHVDQKADALARKDGEPGNPIFGLNQKQRRTLLAIQVAGPGSTDANVLQKDNAKWLDKYYNASSAYFDKVINSDPKKAKAVGINPIWQSPTPSDAVSRKLDAMGQISDSKAKSQYISSNQDLQDYLAKTDQAERAKRAWIGWEQFKGYPTPSAGTQKLLDQFDKLPQHDGSQGGNKSRYLFVQAHPGLASWFTKVASYKSYNDAKLAMYEGHNGSSSSSGSSSGSSSSGGSSGSSFSSSGFSSSSSGGTSNYADAKYLSNPYADVVGADGSKGRVKGNKVSVKKAAIKRKATGKRSPHKPTLTRKRSKA